MDGDRGAHGLGKGILVEARICPTKNAPIARVELNVNDLLMVRARDVDVGG